MKIAKISFISALASFIYIILVALVIKNAEKIFGEMNNLIGPTAFLTLFTLSAAVVGGLILGKPLMFYLDGKKKEAVKLFSAIVGWLFIFLVLVFVYLWVKK